VALYLALPTRTVYWDGAGFALAVDHPGWFPVIEPNHPIYIEVGRALHGLAPSALGLTVLQTLNAVLGAIAVVVVYSIANWLLAEEFDALLLAGLFALSGTWWKFATDADAYIPSILFLLLAARLLLPGRPARPLAVALLHTGAMLFHELAVLFVVPALVGLFGQMRGDRRVLLKYLGVTLILTSAAYYTCFHFATGQWSAGAYWRWITWHTPDSSFSFNLARNAWFTIRGTARLAAGGRLSAFHSGLWELIAIMVLLGLTAVLVWKRPRNDPESRSAGAFLWAWIAVYAGFLFFWLPQNTFYRLFYLPPLILVTVAALRQWGGSRALYTAATLLGTWNYLFYIHPDSLVETNTLVRAALAMRPVWKAGTWVYLGSWNADDWTIFCFNPQVNFKSLERTRLAETTRELQSFAAEGRETWIDRSGIELLDSERGGRQWLCEHSKSGYRYEFSDSKYRVRFERLFP
jgi:hypothetical protein